MIDCKALFHALTHQSIHWRHLEQASGVCGLSIRFFGITDTSRFFRGCTLCFWVVAFSRNAPVPTQTHRHRFLLRSWSLIGISPPQSHVGHTRLGQGSRHWQISSSASFVPTCRCSPSISCFDHSLQICLGYYNTSTRNSCFGINQWLPVDLKIY